MTIDPFFNDWKTGDLNFQTLEKPMTELIQVETPQQIAGIAQLARAIWTDHYVSIVGKAQVDYMLEKFQSEPAIRDQMNEGVEYYLLLQNGAPAAYMAVMPDPETGELMISKLYVSKSVRGQGLGRKMAGFAEDLCRKRGLCTLWLTVNKNNTSSIEWYLRSGFKNAGSIVMDIGNDFVMDDYRMEKIIGAL